MVLHPMVKNLTKFSKKHVSADKWKFPNLICIKKHVCFFVYVQDTCDIYN